MINKIATATLILIFHSAKSDQYVNSTILGSSPRQNLTFPEMVKYDGYTSETHYVNTSDGYILCLHRIPLGDKCSADTGKLPVMLMHGLYLSGDVFVVPGPGKSHAYAYSDNCHDVWVANVRGNKYSRNHTTLNPDEDAKFWDFSFDEMALFDLPAFLDYILGVTKKQQVIYVGHSQGMGILLVLCAKKSEYIPKIKTAFGLSTTAWLYRTRMFVLNLQQLLGPDGSLANDAGINFEIFAHGKPLQSTADYLCGQTTISYLVCTVFVFVLFGYNQFQITPDVLVDFAGHETSGTSYKNFNHWGQVKNKGFREYDYGPIENLVRYNSTDPPFYDVSNVNMDLVFMMSRGDTVSDIADMETLFSKLPNEKNCTLSDSTFGHLDFIIGKDARDLVIDPIVSYMANGSLVCK